MKILVTGKNGQVGFELMRSLSPLGQVVGVDVKECDLTQSASVERLLDRVKPDIIVNPAAYTAVDQAEDESTIVHAVNVQAPKILARYAARKNIPMIHFSTDYVFDGEKEGAYSEEDQVNPKSVYGKTKWLGEEEVRKMAAKHIIIRTSWVFGSHGENFLKTMLKLSQEREKLSVVSDQFGAPTSALFLARLAKALLMSHQESPRSSQSGIYHAVPHGYTSWHGLAQMVIGLIQDMKILTRVTLENVLPIPATEYPLSAPRPYNSRLCNKKLANYLAVIDPENPSPLQLQYWQTEVAAYVHQYAELIKQ